MSTRGSFIIRKDSRDKELYIASDANPDSAGMDVVRIIKNLDLETLYDLLTPEDELTEDDNFFEDTQDFSLPLFVDAVRKGKRYVYQELGTGFIRDSLCCEYGYVLDLDDGTLGFFLGNQKKPQAGNQFGCEISDGYYPCRLAAEFPFAYIRQEQASDIVEIMKSVSKARNDEVLVIEADMTVEEQPSPKEPMAVRQLIIARKDLQMSPGKLAAQVSHASMAFLAEMLRKGGVDEVLSLDTCEVESYHISISMQPEVYNDWLHGRFTKTICEAKNKNQLLKAVGMAEELGLREGEDFFLIRDSCLTELEPEEFDETGEGYTLTCIGFRPLPDDIAHTISKKYQLYR